MSNDKLSMTARAAGFAMACDDDTASTPASKTYPVSPTVPQVPREATQNTGTALVPAQRVKATPAWGLMGFNFWKTA